jgi:hypothetical protein
VPADSLPNAYPPPNPYAPAESQPDVYAQPNPYAPADSQPNAYAPYTPQADSQPQAGQSGGFGQPYSSGETAPSVPYPQADQAQQPYYDQPPAFDQQSPQQGGQPFTGYSGHEFGSPQEPDPPVDPRSQQLLDAYQQAETYQSGIIGTQPDLRVPDYTSQPSPYDDPFGHPQQPPQQQAHQPQPQQQAPQQGQHQPGQPNPYEPQAYQPTHQAPAGWSGGQPADSTVRLDPNSYRGDDPIDPTAIYTPNEPRR